MPHEVVARAVSLPFSTGQVAYGGFYLSFLWKQLPAAAGNDESGETAPKSGASKTPNSNASTGMSATAQPGDNKGNNFHTIHLIQTTLTRATLYFAPSCSFTIWVHIYMLIEGHHCMYMTKTIDKSIKRLIIRRIFSPFIAGKPF